MPFGEEALVASDVDALAVVIELDGGESGAGVPLHGFQCQWIGVAVEFSVSMPRLVLVLVS